MKKSSAKQSPYYYEESARLKRARARFDKHLAERRPPLKPSQFRDLIDRDEFKKFVRRLEALERRVGVKVNH